MWFVLQLYTSASEIPTISYTESLKKITLLGGASSYWPSTGVPRPRGPIDRVCTARYRVLNFWKSLEIWPAIFQTWKMSGKWYILSFHSKATASASEVKSFSFWSNLIQSRPYVCSASQKKLIPESFVFSLLEKVRKSFEFWIQKPVWTLFFTT